MEAPPRAGCVEWFGIRQFAQVIHVQADPVPHLLRMRRRHDAATLLDEQGIVPDDAHARNRVGDRGLGHGELLCGLRHGAFAHDRIEDDEQVQVDPFHGYPSPPVIGGIPGKN
jgi:hypothetical protein